MPIQLHCSWRHLPADDPNLLPEGSRQGQRLLQPSGQLVDRLDSEIVPALQSAKEVLSTACQTFLNCRVRFRDNALPSQLQQIFVTMLGKDWRSIYERVFEAGLYTTEMVLNEIRIPEIDHSSAYANERPWYGTGVQNAQPSSSLTILREGEEDTALVCGTPDLGDANGKYKGCVIHISSAALAEPGYLGRDIILPASTIHEGTPIHHFTRNLPYVLIHELMHFESRLRPKDLRCVDVKLPFSELENMEISGGHVNWDKAYEYQKHPDESGEEYASCYEFDLCCSLAQSSMAESTYRNADSLALVFVMIWLGVKYPEWDWTSGVAKRREGQRFSARPDLTE